MKIDLTIKASVACSHEGCTATQTITITREAETPQNTPYPMGLPFPGEQYLRDFLHDADAWSFNAQGASFCAAHTV